MEVWRGIAEGLNAAIVNPSIILGEGNWDKSSTNLFKIVHKEFPFYTKGATGWVDVKDVVNLMKMLMESTITAERFILNGGNHSFKDVFTWMALAMNKKPPHKLATPWMTEIVWRLQYIKSKLTGHVATITKETAKSALEVKSYDNSKVKKAFTSYQFSSIENTIYRIASVYK
jgi:nucleoside-diphosphate-sugar epimerase